MIERIPAPSAPSVLFLIRMAYGISDHAKVMSFLEKTAETSLLKGPLGSISLKHILTIQ